MTAGAPSPDVVLVPMGVGALAAAAVEHGPPAATIVVAEPEDAACGLASTIAGHPVEVPGPHRSIMAGLNCGNVSIVAWPVIHRGVHAFVTVTDAAAENAMRALARVGIVAGETGAAALAGLHALADRGPATGTVPELTGRHALVLCTEGATDPVNYARIVGRPPPT
jgi:diaminopropionate ammonia-lyase